MPGPTHNQNSVAEALKTLSYKAALNDTQLETVDVDVSTQSLAFAAPLYEDEVPRGCLGITVESRGPGADRIGKVYDKEETRELYEAVYDRAKWFTRAYVTPGARDHILFFFETTCRYNVHSQEVRIPGVIRGPDAVQGHLPEGMDPVVDEDTYLVPAHLLSDRYWERTQKCVDCRIPYADGDVKTWIPRDDPETESYTCPVCETETDGISGTTDGTWFMHDRATGGEPRQNRCGPVSKDERYAFMDWLLDVEPGATTQTPGGFPDAPTTLSDGTVVDWLSPLEPVTNVTSDYLQGVRPFITIQPPEYDLPIIVYSSDFTQLGNAVKQQHEDQKSA